jgi:hypothetical protein
MRTRYDQFGKQLLREGLESRGAYTSPLEVSPEPHQADGYFVPELTKPSQLDGTLLGRMTEKPCAFELFSTAPDLLDLENCLRKHLNLRHVLRKPGTEVVLPRQWIICAERSYRPFCDIGVGFARDWSSGFYDLPRVHDTSIVVVEELRETRATLLLRLLGRRQTLRKAIAELKTLDDEAIEKCIAIPLLLRYRIEAASEQTSPADEEFIVDTQEVIEMLEKRGELRGELRGEIRGEIRGELRGERKAVLRQLRYKFGEVSEDIVKRVQDADTQLLERLERNVLSAKSINEVFAS